MATRSFWWQPRVPLPGTSASTAFCRRSSTRIRDRRRLVELDGSVDLHHLFSPRLVGYPWLGRVEKPVVYSLTTSLGATPPATGSPGPGSARRGALRRPRYFEPPAGFARRWTVADPADRHSLLDRGYRPVDAVLPGVDLPRFSAVEPPSGEGLVLLAGSAPWSRRQFYTKGVHLLLDAVEAIPDLHLVLLWRGVLASEISRRVDGRGLGDRVEVILGPVDVSQVLARVHAAVVLAQTPRLVKSFPPFPAGGAGGRPAGDGERRSGYSRGGAGGRVWRGGRGSDPGAVDERDRPTAP